MLHLHFHDSKPIPHLAERIARQKREGGRLILYRRAWSALVVTITQDRVEYVPLGNSRVVAGWPHVLFTLFLGIWSPAGIVTMPLLLILNLRGGADVTAQFSQASIDPLRMLSPDPRQAEQDILIAQWTFVVLGLLALVFLLYFCFDHPKPRPDAPVEIARELRLQQLTQKPPANSEDKKDALYAVLMDTVGNNATITVLASSTGDASVYGMGNVGIINGIGNGDVRKAAASFLDCASKHVGLASPTTDYSYPNRSHVRVFFVTRSGVRSVTFSVSEARTQGTDAHALYASATEVFLELSKIAREKAETGPLTR